ncbi:Biotin carboxyl carrier protein of acetyl-CoA carboxylase [Candidatus Arthromitus sp. SFB-mouse-NL]|uniref:acetyl-CoA carboxylase biotin carboxyl carrier protein n=1 Tax=Candidatus Arthromitus sp. SFB-mouse-NL TaxID=1508644 RepID=UPI00049B17AF|nr:acetyl-CoA carboxylase biotin carboxyl carrier protein [Candidatus Arthromitus sp. SFB-mouse-NL]AID44829.1 Biotin carboxyl carrier protein of acetyl-CoA carboxylase [Candidatus Arthromitus sp. SFB-mouse-NL]
MISFKEIMELIDKINNSSLSLMEINYQDLYLKLDKESNRLDSVSTNQITKPNFNNNIRSENDINSVIDNLSNNSSNDVKEEVSEENIEYITSPMVGTVYLASSPEKQPYISVGQGISCGDTVCIVEAMKLMNEIESEFSGTVIEILVKNAQMVEFGQKLFKIKKN